MVDHIVEASGPRGRIEIRSGVGRRRRWSGEDKGRIVAQSYASGAVVSEVARRHEISPQHLFAWRKAARDGRLALPEDLARLFVPVMLTAQKAELPQPKPSAPSITIETVGIVVRAECGVDVGWLAAVLRAVKALA
jgi:transposase